MLAEVPGAARLNLQPFVSEKMCSSAYRVSSPPGPGGRGGGPTGTKTFLGQVGMCVQNFIKIGAGVWISISPLHTIRPTNICTPIFIDIDRRYKRLAEGTRL